MTPRVLAVHVLRDIERRRGFSNRILSEHLERAPGLRAADRGLVTHLVYGVLRHRTRLDLHIDAKADRPRGIKGEVRELLRVGALELRELGHPPHAAISEAARTAGQLAGGARLRGLVQAILSWVAARGDEQDAKLAALAPVEALSKRWSIPRWLAERWVARLGPETALRRGRALAEIPPIDLRVDVHRTTRDEVLERLRADHPRAEVELVDDQPQALRVRRAGDLAYGPLYGEGLVSVQGLAAQQPAIWLEPRPGERVLDACAGMGTKTQQLAELMQRRGTIVAADIEARRLAEHDALKARAGLDADGLSVSVVHGDLTTDLAPLDDAGPFDAVLLDVPCTGLGNLARHPEIRWLRTEQDLHEHVPGQRALLERSLARVRSGGRLVYAVCSFEPEEGPELVESVAAAHGWTIDRARTYTPEDDATEGFYVARLRR